MCSALLRLDTWTQEEFKSTVVFYRSVLDQCFSYKFKIFLFKLISKYFIFFIVVVNRVFFLPLYLLTSTSVLQISLLKHHLTHFCFSFQTTISAQPDCVLCIKDNSSMSNFLMSADKFKTLHMYCRLEYTGTFIIQNLKEQLF